MPDSAIYLIGYIIAFLIAVAIMRAIFSIGTIVRNLQAQTKLLSLMAKQSGIDEVTIDKILAKSKDEAYSPPKKKKEEKVYPIE